MEVTLGENNTVFVYLETILIMWLFELRLKRLKV